MGIATALHALLDGGATLLDTGCNTPDPAEVSQPSKLMPGVSRDAAVRRLRVAADAMADALEHPTTRSSPYAIRRRQADRAAEERIRLSEDVRQVQSRLSYFQAWTQAESPGTGQAYNELVAQLRRVAGASMHDAWVSPRSATTTA